MRVSTARLTALLCLLLVFSLTSFAQSAHRKRYPKTKPNEEQPQTAPQGSKPKPASQNGSQEKSKEKEEPLDVAPDPEAIKIGTELVSVPVIVSDYNDIYIPDLKQPEFTLYEDGVKQEIVFFATVKEPFNVVLLLDTSGSTKEKLRQIQGAAKEFVAQLQPKDRVKIINFDDQINDLSEFTSDRATLREAIERAQSGVGTKLYDAMKYALNTLTRVQGRRAIVLFTDGVDNHSDTTQAADNIAQLEESGIIVYPIRYDTRRETEALVREQQERATIADRLPGRRPTSGGGRPPTGTTPPTTPGEHPVPTSRPGGQDPYQLPVPPIYIPRPNRYPDGRYPDGRDPRSRYPDDRYPDDRYPDSRYPDSRYPGGGGRYPDDGSAGSRLPDPRYPNPPVPRRSPDDGISIMLDGMYRTAALYLNDLATNSGGKLQYAEDLTRLPDAFAKIADELRNQYSLGFYPSNPAHDGKYRKLQVKVSRKNVVVRARPGYRAPKE